MRAGKVERGANAGPILASTKVNQCMCDPRRWNSKPSASRVSLKKQILCPSRHAFALPMRKLNSLLVCLKVAVEDVRGRVKGTLGTEVSEVD